MSILLLKDLSLKGRLLALLVAALVIAAVSLTSLCDRQEYSKPRPAPAQEHR